MASDGHPINILDLPLEALLCIFSFVKFNAPIELDGLYYLENLTQNTTDIKSIRLVCRKFASTCAPLLLPIVSCSILEPDCKGIEKLEKISRHADFSPFVRVVHVRLGFYDRVIATSIENHALYLSWAWRKFAKERHGPSFDRIHKIVGEWMLENQAGPESKQILRSMHAEYQRRYSLQLELHRSGSPLRRLAEAMARMPTATRLVFDDERHHTLSRLGPLMLTVLGKPEAASEDDLLSLAAPMSWLDCWQLKDTVDRRSPLNRCRPPIDMLINLPVAIHRAGVSLTGLRVLNLQIPNYIPAWGMLDRLEETEDPVELAEPADLSQACRALKVLEITPGYWSGGGMRSGGRYMAVHSSLEQFSWPVRDRARTLRPWTLFFDVVRHMLSPTLRQVHLDPPMLSFSPHVQGFWPPPSPLIFEFDFGKAMFGQHPIPDLEVLHLSNASIGLPFGLGDVLRGAPRLREVRLLDVQVEWLADLDGHPADDGWAWLLEVLRELFPRMWENMSSRSIAGAVVVRSTPPVMLRHVSWMEYTGSPKRLERLARSLFEDKMDDGCGFTAVENYIRGAGDVNPLVQAYEMYPVDDWDNYSTLAF